VRPRRYQLRKDAVAIVGRGHPWIFRDQLSSAAAVFRDGDWLRLVDGENRVVGHGIYEDAGAIAIRILRRGPEPADAAYLAAQLETALARRAPLAARTDGLRLLHGESDGIPAVVIDRFGDTLVVASYSAGADALARFLAGHVHACAHDPRPAGASPTDVGRAAAPEAVPRSIVGPAHRVVLRPAKRRRGTAPEARLLRGTPAEVVQFIEDGLPLWVDLAAGHKTGTYLDLRGLRQALATASLAGARVLNLFAYSGMLGRAAEAAGAATIVQVDASERALAFAATHHVVDPARHDFVTADVFTWLPAHAPAEPYDLVIVDPPAMTSSKARVPAALAAYRKLYRAAAPLVRPGGALVAACCTSRIERATFHRTVRDALGPDFVRERELAPELDHPVGFREADYLKIGWWRRG
jgi:23S rRNA (cytosine1962-C5)-methyltransferase